MTWKLCGGLLLHHIYAFMSLLSSYCNIKPSYICLYLYIAWICFILKVQRHNKYPELKEPVKFWRSSPARWNVFQIPWICFIGPSGKETFKMFGKRRTLSRKGKEKLGGHESDWMSMLSITHKPEKSHLRGGDASCAWAAMQWLNTVKLLIRSR